MNAELIEQRKKIFYEFLVQNGILFEYHNCMVIRKLKTIDDVVNNVNPISYFLGVINFGENWKYWHEIDRKWQKQIHDDKSIDWLSSPKK